LTALLQPELELETSLVQVLVLVRQPELAQEQVLQQELELALALVQQPEQEQVSQLAQVLQLALHPHHRPLQSLFQQQLFHLRPLESLSACLLLAMELRYLLCQLILRTVARQQQSCRQLF
jgi:hypothetical protein